VLTSAALGYLAIVGVLAAQFGDNSATTGELTTSDRITGAFGFGLWVASPGLVWAAWAIRRACGGMQRQHAALAAGAVIGAALLMLQLVALASADSSSTGALLWAAGPFWLLIGAWIVIRVASRR
jgi:hypothetical protein